MLGPPRSLITHGRKSMFLSGGWHFIYGVAISAYWIWFNHGRNCLAFVLKSVKDKPFLFFFQRLEKRWEENSYYILWNIVENSYIALNLFKISAATGYFNMYYSIITLYLAYVYIFQITFTFHHIRQLTLSFRIHIAVCELKRPCLDTLCHNSMHNSKCRYHCISNMLTYRLGILDSTNCILQIVDLLQCLW